MHAFRRVRGELVALYWGSTFAVVLLCFASYHYYLPASGERYLARLLLAMAFAVVATCVVFAQRRGFPRAEGSALAKFLIVVWNTTIGVALLSIAGQILANEGKDNNALGLCAGGVLGLIGGWTIVQSALMHPSLYPRRREPSEREAQIFGRLLWAMPMALLLIPLVTMVALGKAPTTEVGPGTPWFNCLAALILWLLAFTRLLAYWSANSTRTIARVNR